MNNAQILKVNDLIAFKYNIKWYLILIFHIVKNKLLKKNKFEILVLYIYPKLFFNYSLLS